MEKTISLGEITSYITVVAKVMQEQGNTPTEILQMIDGVNQQFGINLPNLAE